MDSAPTPRPLPAPRPSPTSWLVVMRWGGAGVAVVVLAWLSYSRDGWVPILSGADFGIHEFGHMLFMWAPPMVVYLAGSLVQILVPASLAGYFSWRGDRLGVLAALAWLGVSLNSVSVYIFDATRMELLLWGDDGSGANHDWRNILSELGWLNHTDAIAAVVRMWSAAAFLAALVLAGWFGYRELNDARRPAPPGRSTRLP